ncbi:MAG: hypothetical protein Fur0044_02930 [Anaerolineae bacterium]|nr:hypothetical protein [Anaerolineales bacterium]MCQ3973191.1 hypothetical protein [Anaerolineae bacterium]
MPDLEIKPQARSSLAWIGQAVSGVLLMVILLLHMYFQHFEGQGLLNAGQVVVHVSSASIFFLEILFVIVVTYHALLGVRAVIFDFNLGESTRRTISVGLTVLGIVTAAYGIMLAILIQTQILA